MSNVPSEGHPEYKHQYPFHESVDWGLRQRTVVRRALNFLERISLACETFVNKVVRRPEFNPLYHTGTITTFLLLIILVTGVYLTFFYQFGFDSSYQAVSNIEANFVGRIMRALHRYASGAAVITALLHGWRTFFQDRFRGPRWLAWVSGIGMAVVVWFIGITGYWLIWDERAHLLNKILFDLIGNTKLGVSFLVNYLISDAATTGWVFIIIVITLHLGLSGLVGYGFWLHIKRLARPKLLPPKYWTVVFGGLLFIYAVAVPVGKLPQAAFERIPAEIPLDLFFLSYLPAALRLSPWVFWGGVILVIAGLVVIPWALIRPPLPPVDVNAERCTGCTLCEADCPYNAIAMVARTDESKYKSIAQIKADRCVACGVCIGSCPTLALTLGQQPAEPLWESAVARFTNKSKVPTRVVFACERHVFQGAKPYLNDPETQVVPVTCVGMVHPNLLTSTLESGATQVQVIGCPPEDCANREGNRHLQQRLDRERKPVLRTAYLTAPITTDWLPPNQFKDALDAVEHQKQATTYSFTFNKRNWISFMPALILLAVVFGIQVLASAIPWRPNMTQTAGIEIIMNHRAGYPLEDLQTGLEPSLGVESDTRLVLQVDEEILLDEIYPPRGSEQKSKIFERFQIAPGKHHVTVTMADRQNTALDQVLLDDSIDLKVGEILVLRYEDTNIGKDPAAGEKLYSESSLGTNAGCRICHSLDPDETLVGPSFAGIATRAAERVPGMLAEEYLRQSIIDPDAYVVEGYPSGLMVPNLAETLSDAQIDDLVAFLMTLE
jgi:ferredoxin/cytochrome c551/c552